MGKIIFMDVDGTLCDYSGHVPESAKKAIESARRKGHKVFLCTGRSLPEITPELRTIGIDGIIGAGGGYIEVDEEVLFHNTMDETFVAEIMDYFKANGVEYYLESNEGLFASSHCFEAIMRVAADGMDSNSPEYGAILEQLRWFQDILDLNKDEKVNLSEVNKMSFISIDHPFEEVEKEFSAKFSIYRSTVPQFGVNSGEAAIKGLSKKTAIQWLLNYLKIGKENTIAYGDGDNDLEMFDAVAYRIAMENGTDRLKALADEITTSPEEDGIHLSFSKNGLL